MSAQHRVDPLSRLVGAGAPPRLAPFSAQDAEPDDAAAAGVEAGGDGVDARDDAVVTTNVPQGGRGATNGGRGRSAGATTSAATTTAAGTAGRGAGVDATPAAAAPLDALAPVIDQARSFAERWDAPYRPEIFRVALGQLLGTTVVDPPIVGAPRAAGAPAVLTSTGDTGAPRAGALLGPTEKLARQLNVDADAVERAVHFEDGKVTILGRIDGKTRRELQIRYGMVLLYVKEIALATRLVDVEDLRAVAVEHGCYDQNNFIGNFKKAQQDGLMREQPTEKGSRARRYMLTQKGMNEAAALLRELVLQ